jgi:hypothetical protein
MARENLPLSGILVFFIHVPQANSKKFSHGSTVSSILSSREFAKKIKLYSYRLLKIATCFDTSGS